MKKGMMFLVSLLSMIIISACSSPEKKEEKKESSESSVVKVVEPSSSSDSGNQAINQLEIAEDFMTMYIEQTFDLVKLKEKEKALEDYAGDSSLDSAIQAVDSLQVEVADFLKTKQIKNMASVTLIERKVQSLTVYQNGALYFSDVSYSESGPAFAGSFDRRKQFTFKIEDGKVVRFEEVIYK